MDGIGRNEIGMTKRRIIYGVVGAVVLLAVALSFRGQPVVAPFTQPETRTVREFIAEDAETRLADKYTVDMPVNGTVLRIALEVGDIVEAGQVVANVDPYDLKRRIDEIDARIAQARAQASGVDVQKPNREQIESSRVKVEEMESAVEVAHKARSVLQLELTEAEKDYERALGLLDAGAVSQS